MYKKKILIENLIKYGYLKTENIIMKLLPYLGIMGGGVIMIFMLYILLDHLPGILAELRSLVTEMRSLKGASVKTGLILPLLIKGNII